MDPEKGPPVMAVLSLKTWDGDFVKGLPMSETALCISLDFVKMPLPSAQDRFSSVVLPASMRPRSPRTSAKATAIC